jgi:transposase InsO family protein
MTQALALGSEQPSLTVNAVCEALEVSRSSFYSHRHKDQRLRRREDHALAEHIKSAFEDSQGIYGSPRLVRELRCRGVRTSKTRVRRLMQRENLCPHQKRRVRVRTTKSNPHLPVAPHLLLEAPPAQRPGERFYSDITYIPTQEGWLFTAATLDAYSRKCAGWSAADNMETPLVLRAAERAFALADAPDTIHH